MPSISIIIPAYNEERHIAKCLNAIKSQLTEGDEIIVVDNNSKDDTAKIANKLGATVIKEDKQGLSYARNKGFEEAKNNIIARTDADTIVANEWLDAIRDYYSGSATSNTATTGPVFLKEPRPVKLGLHNGITKRALGHQNLIGSNMAMPKSLWLKIVPKLSNDDEQYAEDTEISGLIIKNGGAIEFISKMKVYTSWRWMKQHPIKNYRQWNRKLKNTSRLFQA